MGYNVETNKQTNKQTKTNVAISVKIPTRVGFSRTIYMAIVNSSSRVNPGLNNGYPARGADPA